MPIYEKNAAGEWVPMQPKQPSAFEKALNSAGYELHLTDKGLAINKRGDMNVVAEMRGRNGRWQMIESDPAVEKLIKQYGPKAASLAASQNQPARPLSVAALRATRTAGIPEGQTPVIQRIANWLTARGENDVVQPGEAKKVAAFHKAAAAMHQQAGQAEAAKAHQAAAAKWEGGMGASISAAADSQMAKLINYQDGGIVDGTGRDQLKAANDGINAAKNATPANLRHLYKSGIRSDRNGYIWSWVLKEFPRKGAGLSTGRPPIPKVGDRVFVAGIGEGEVTQKYAGKIEVMFVGANVGKWFMEYDKRIKPAGAASLSNGASTMQTETKPSCGMSGGEMKLKAIKPASGSGAYTVVVEMPDGAVRSFAKNINELPQWVKLYTGTVLNDAQLGNLRRGAPQSFGASLGMSRKAAYMGRVAASQGVAAGGLTDSLYRAYERELFDIVHDTRSAAGELQDRLAKVQRFAAVQQQLKPEFKSLLGKAQQVAKQRAMQDRQSYDQNAGASVAAAAPPFAKKPEAQAPAQPAPQAPAAPQADPEPDPADAPLGMSRKAKFVRRMLAKGSGGVGAQPAGASVGLASRFAPLTDQDAAARSHVLVSNDQYNAMLGTPWMKTVWPKLKKSHGIGGMVVYGSPDQIAEVKAKMAERPAPPPPPQKPFKFAAAIDAAVTKKMDHAAYQRGLKGKTPDELKYIIKDAREAMQAMPDGPNAGYYQDEIHYAQMELKKRQGAGASIAAAASVPLSIKKKIKFINAAAAKQFKDAVPTMLNPGPYLAVEWDGRDGVVVKAANDAYFRKAMTLAKQIDEREKGGTPRTSHPMPSKIAPPSVTRADAARRSAGMSAGGTVAAAITSRNTVAGFHGTARLNGLDDDQKAGKLYSQVAQKIASQFRLQPNQVRDMLDSKVGRHIADDMVVNGQVNPNLPTWLGSEVKKFFKTYDPAAFEGMSLGASIAAGPSYPGDGTKTITIPFANSDAAAKMIQRAKHANMRAEWTNGPTADGKGKIFYVTLTGTPFDIKRLRYGTGASISAAALPPGRQGFRQIGGDGPRPVWFVVSVQTGQAVSKMVTREMAEKIKDRLASTGGTYEIKRGSPYGASISAAAGDGSNSGTVREAGELYQFLSSTQSRLSSLKFVSPEAEGARKKVAETIARMTAQADTLRHSLAKKLG